MPRRKNLPLLIFMVLILAFVPALLAARPVSAKVELNAGKGEAVWFFRSCHPGRPGAVAKWALDLDPSMRNQTSLQFQVQNAYPRYQLNCELYFANTGKFPIAVKNISVYNPNPDDLILTAIMAHPEKGRAIQPCGSRPRWGNHPASLPFNCQAKLKLVLTIGPNVGENIRLDFSVQVRVEEKRK
jgi:hypothetical protein